MYIPKQKDLVWINFDPSRGKEIKKRRPAVVMSSTAYNKSTHFIVVCPITSTIRNFPGFINLPAEKYKVHGQINCQQLYSYDFTKRAGRKVELIGTLDDQYFYQAAQLVKMIFNFGF